MRPVAFDRWLARSPYEVLGVDPRAGEAEIKRAWRAAAKANHPDRVGGDASAMAEINAAFEVLEKHRADLDAYLGRAPRAAPRGGTTPSSALPWCVRCGATDATLRVAGYPTVTAFGGLREEVHREVLCAGCRDRAAGQAALTSALSGWWARGGPSATVRAIQRIWRDDYGADPAADAAVLRAGAASCFRQGRRDEARRMLTASLALRDDAGGRSLLAGWGGPLAPLAPPWSERALGFALRYGGAFAPVAVLEVLALALWSSGGPSGAEPPAAEVPVEVAAPAPAPPPAVVLDPADPRANALHALERRGHELQAEVAALDAQIGDREAALTQAASRVAELVRDGVTEAERPEIAALGARIDGIAAEQAEATAERDRLAAALAEARTAYTLAFEALTRP